MITPRSTRLVRVSTLHAYRGALVALATAGSPADARDRLIVVPTRAAAAHLVRSIERGLAPGAGLILPELITADDLVVTLAARLEPRRPQLTAAEREVLLGVACRAAQAAGAEPPFQLRPGLIAEALRFYDVLRRQRKDLETFERLALGALEPGAAEDRGAERLVRQTRFLAAAYREFEVRSAAAGHDEHVLRARLRDETALRPWREVVLAVTDRAFDRYGLWPADWDLLTRVPGLERLTIVVTDTTLGGALHERIHDLLPGIEEVRHDADAGEPPRLLMAAAGPVHVVRDREEEVALFARRVRRQAAAAPGPLDAHALVVCQPLPYVYVAREVLRSAGVPSQAIEPLPLAAEPYAAVVDLLLTAVAARFSRDALIALVRSPHLVFAGPAAPGPADAGEPAPRRPAGADGELTLEAIAALDRALSDAGYLGERAALDRIAGADVLRAIVDDLAPLQQPAPAAAQLGRLLAFLARYERPVAGEAEGPVPSGVERPVPVDGEATVPSLVEGRAPADRHRRARGGVRATLAAFRDAYARFDDALIEFDDLAGLVRRGIEVRTFSPATGDGGVHVVDAEAARFGHFEHVHLAGLVEGEWPDPPRRDIFYSAAVLRDLGWPKESLRIEQARAAFTDLLRLPASQLTISTFTLEADALVNPSPFLELVDRAALEPIVDPLPLVRVFEDERLTAAPAVLDGLPAVAHEAARRRLDAPPPADRRFHGATAPHRQAAYSLSALERYQDCGFKFFAADVLGLEEPPEDEPALSPRARGRFVHEVFQRFFDAWDTRASGTITPERMGEARVLFAAVAEPMLARLPAADAALERTRLFGSAISVGIADVVLGIEAARPVPVRERWLEYRLEGEFTLGGDGERRVPLRGVADRIDLLEGRRLRVIDYKTGAAPHPGRALQVPIYALCARERLMARDAAPWAVDEAAYVAFSGRRALVPVIGAGARDAGDTLDEARHRVFDLVDAMARGEFAPRPHDPAICRYCAYATVCRKEYAGVD